MRTRVALLMLFFCSLPSEASKVKNDIVPYFEINKVMGIFVEKVVFKKNDHSAQGSGRMMIFHVTLRSCNHIILNEEFIGPTEYKYSFYNYGSGNSLNYRKEKSCPATTVELIWDPGIQQADVQSQEITLRIPKDDSNVENFLIKTTAFRTRGILGPGSEVVNIVDYKNIVVKSVSSL